MTYSGKIDKIYFFTKGLVVIPVALWIYLSPEQSHQIFQFSILLSVYLAINIVMYWFSIKKYIKGSNLMFSLSPVDAVFLYFVIMSYGGIHSQLNISYYLLMALLSIYLPIRKVIIVAFIFSISYILSTLNILDSSITFVVFIKTIYIWLTAGIGSIISYSMATSEKKLLKTLDTLNERTWELESSQLMLENMYETTRMLSAILDLEQLLKEVLNIANDLLRVKKCIVFLSATSGGDLSKYADLIKGKKMLYDPPIAFSALKPAESISHEKANDLTETRISFTDKVQILELPLVSHGKVMGLVYLELQKKDELSEKERKTFRVFANSTAIAIDNARLHAKMQELTIIDELTGLYNYRHFRITLADEIRRADRYHQQLSLLMVDVDHFKKLNDSQGHQTGNIILQEIASIIKHSVRDVDIVARFGGEEFIVILPQTYSQNASVIAERIRSQTENSYFTNSQGQRDLKATVSIGIAVYPNGIASSNQLIEKVDQALYRAKNDGRNRVYIIPSNRKEQKGTMVQ